MLRRELEDLKYSFMGRSSVEKLESEMNAKMY